MKAVDAHKLPPEVQTIRKDIIESAFNGEPLSFQRLKSKIPEGYMTIAMLRAATGLTQVESKRLIANGTLVPVMVSSQGWALYNESTIESLRTRPSGRGQNTKLAGAQHAATHSYTQAEGLAVFAQIKMGTSGPDIALSTDLHPALVAQIMRDWSLLASAIFVDGDMLEEINALEGRLRGPFPIKDGAGLVSLLRTIAKRQLCSCERRPKKYCSYCAEEKYGTR